MVWGCKAGQEVGYRCRIDGRIDAELTISILQDEFLATMVGQDRADLSTA
jgi:HrpA-like RNA helicase